MRVAVLTSSRADFGIYLPLLRAMKEDAFFTVSIIAFGTHLSPYHGNTIQDIKAQGFNVSYEIECLLLTDSNASVASSYGITVLKFAELWKEHAHEFDLVFCLGDRFEMFAAVSAGIPFQIPFAHIHGGETTLGAIDNIYRHALSLASSVHFTATRDYAERVKQIVGNSQDVYPVGALSLDNLREIPLLTKEEFLEKWDVDLDLPSILITVHPETVHSGNNERYSKMLIESLIELLNEYQLIITMPNADTLGSVYRQAFENLKRDFFEKVRLIENFGTQSYFTAMKHVNFLMGNTSSGIIEAASFNKYVIDLGDRQKGRAAGDNVLHVTFEKEEILKAVTQIRSRGEYQGENLYFSGGAVNKIVQVIKEKYSDEL